MKARIVLELRQHYPLAGLLKVAGLARSTFYYQQRVLQMGDKYASLKAKIRSVFDMHKGRYGYRRITAAIRQEGMIINHKTVQRLMGELRLKSCVRVKKYRAYRGEVGHVAPNVLERRFDAARPNDKWVTDVTEFNVNGEKLYLSPVLDLYNGEIVAYEIARRPLFDMVGTMLKKAFSRLGPHDKPILHSDQGWQYQMSVYCRALQKHSITQRKLPRQRCDGELLRHAEVRVLPPQQISRSRRTAGRTEGLYSLLQSRPHQAEIRRHESGGVQGSVRAGIAVTPSNSAGSVHRSSGHNRRRSSLAGTGRRRLIAYAMQATNQLLALQAKQSIQTQQLQLTQGRATSLELARQAAAVERGREVTRRFLGTGTAYTPQPVTFYGN